MCCAFGVRYVNPNEKLFSDASGELKAFHDAFPLKVMSAFFAIEECVYPAC